MLFSLELEDLAQEQYRTNKLEKQFFRLQWSICFM